LRSMTVDASGCGGFVVLGVDAQAMWQENGKVGAGA
jgi:hypothetical protein